MRTNDATHATSWQRNRPHPPQRAVRRHAVRFIAALLLLGCPLAALAQGLNTLWAKSGGGVLDDGAYGIGVDASGSAYVVGVYRANAAFGAFTLTNKGGGLPDVFLLKYDGAGNVVWARNGGGSGQDNGFGISVDPAGNSYIAGEFYSSTATFGSFTLTNSAQSRSVFVAKYDNAGNAQWATMAPGVNGGGAGFVELFVYKAPVAFDQAGNCYVAGEVFGNAMFGTTTLTNQGGQNIFLAKLDSTGHFQWATQVIADPAVATAVTTDTSGNVYLAGAFGGTATTSNGGVTLTSRGGYDILLAKYNSAGTLLWATNAGGSGDDYGFGVAVDAAGSIYLGAGCYGSSNAVFGALSKNFPNDNITARYDNSGNAIWAASTGLGYVSFDNAGNLNTYGSAHTQWGAVYKYDTNGNLLSGKWGGLTAGTTLSWAVALDSAGNPCAAGQFAGATASMAGITLTNSGPANTYDTMVARLSAGAPEIVLQPQSQTVSVSPLSPPVNATFSVTAWGAAPLNFRWWFNGTNLLAGATNAVLSFTNVQPTNAGGYSVILSNASGSLTSQVATLTVTTPPPITMQPQSQTVASGTNVFFSVTASGTQPLSYQWRLNGVNLQNIVITAAGNGTAGFSGDGGPATNASLSYPFGLATDAAGNLFIAEVNNNRIRRLATNGTISTVAGNGTNGYSGDGGPATNASFYGPSFVAVDGLGNVFISDTSNNRVRRVGVDGLIATVAGNGTNIYSGDGGAATNAGLSGPSGLQVDASGNLIIAVYYDNRVRRVGTNGIITTIAGGGAAYPGDGGAATNASLNIPDGLALDAAGNLFFAEVGHNRIRKVDTNGIITTVAGTGSPGFSGSEDGGPAASAKLNFPYGVALDPFGNLFIADSENYRVRRVGADGVISTLAGNGTYGFSGDGGPATNASMRWDYGVAADAFGNVFFSDTGGNNRVREVLTAQGPSLQLRGVALTNAGSYDVVVANTYGSVTSTVASLTIILALAITNQPQSQTVAVGTNATFSVGISGNFPSYQWWFNGTNRIAGATNSVLTISNAQPVNSGNYLVIVSNLLGAVTSQLATLSVETTFAQITNVNPVTDAGPASSAVWADYNNDGFLDVLIIGPSGNNYLYRNNGNGTFTVATNFASDACCANGAVWGDYDNDGNVDLFIANAANAVNYLYHNNGPPLYGFTRVIQGNLGTAAENSYSGAWGDYDNDGYLDLFVADRVNSSNLLYHNNRDGTFSRVLGAGIFTNGGNEPHSFSAGTAWADYDDDGWPDLFVANFSGQNNFLYHNNRDGTFTPVVAGSIVDDGGESHACAWGDYDNDGWPDLFVANHPGTNFLYRNNGDGSFTRVTNSVLTEEMTDSLNCSWVDFDNDGWLDLFVVNVNQQPVLYRNLGGGAFQKMTNSTASAIAGNGGAAAWGDYDNDGFPDLFISDPKRLYHNNANSNQWIKVRCIGTASNRSAIGAKIRVSAKIGGIPRTQLREVSGGDGFGTQNSLNPIFGLGDATNIDLLRIEWPSGKVQQFTNVAPRQLLTVQEQTTLYFAVNGSGSVNYSPVRSNYIIGETLSLTATPGRYYTFLRWSDGNTNAIRSYAVGLSNVLTAIFTNTVPLETIVLKQWDKSFGGSEVDELYGGVRQTIHQL